MNETNDARVLLSRFVEELDRYIRIHQDYSSQRADPVELIRKSIRLAAADVLGTSR